VSDAKDPPADAARSPTASDAGAARVFVDAIEGEVARLLLGVEAFEVPVRLLPPGAKEGSWLRLSLELAPPPPPDSADVLRRRLGQDDDGGDIKL